MHTYLSHQKLRQGRKSVGLLDESEVPGVKKNNFATKPELIDDAQYEEVLEDEYISDKKAKLEGYGFTQMDPEKEVNSFTYRVVDSSSNSRNQPTNRYYTPLEARYGSMYARHNTRSAKGNWHDSTVD